MVRCERCGTQHHAACFAEHGRCTVLGCVGTRPAAGGDLVRAVGPGELHPFLPIGAQRLERRVSFLSVTEQPRDRHKRADAPWLRLEAPPAVTSDGRLEATLSAFSPRPLRGAGLRLRLAAALVRGGGADGAERLPLAHDVAVVRGSAPRGWLERLRLWRAPERTGMLLRSGVSTFRLAFDPAPLLWRGPLEDDALGPVVRLTLRAELEGEVSLRSPAHRVYLVEGRPVPEPIAALAPGPRLPAPAAPPLRQGAPSSWLVAPVLVHALPPVAVAFAAVRHEAQDPDPVTADALALALDPLPVSAAFATGAVRLELHRHQLAGRLELALAVERRVKGRWCTYAHERVVLAEESEGHVAGQHVVRFVTPLPRALRADGASRRLRVRASLVGEGAPLRSEEVRRVRGQRARPA